jgi:hypothetical protein
MKMYDKLGLPWIIHNESIMHIYDARVSAQTKEFNFSQHIVKLIIFGT